VTLNITVFVAIFWEEKYREQVILNASVFVVSVWEGIIERMC
jgi:hypothetical protein